MWLVASEAVTTNAQPSYHSVLERALVHITATYANAAFVVEETIAPLALVRLYYAVRAAVQGAVLMELLYKDN